MSLAVALGLPLGLFGCIALTKRKTCLGEALLLSLSLRNGLLTALHVAEKAFHSTVQSHFFLSFGKD